MHKIGSVDSQENCENFGYQMLNFKAKMHQIRFRLGLRARPRWGSLQRSPGEGKREGGRGGEGKREGRGGKFT